MNKGMILWQVIIKGNLPITKDLLKVCRKSAIKQYSTNTTLANIIPIVVEFEGEEGVDLGGICCDLFSGFWEEAHMKMFSGSAQLAPIIHTDIDIHQYSTLGQIISHGYLCCGFLPTRLAFPVLALVFLGCSVSTPQETTLRSFVEFMSHESS